MNAFTAAVLACRLLALFVLYQGLTMLSFLPIAVSAALQANQFSGLHNSGLPDVIQLAPTWSLLLSVLLPLLISGAFSAFLWVKANWLAAQMAPAAMPANEAAPPPGNLQPILLTVVGVFVLATAIPEAGRLVVSALLTPDNISQVPSEIARAAADRWALLLRFLLGCGLLFGASPLSRALGRLKSD